MLRRSLRLQDAGYYTEEGTPSISYKEILCRIFRRRKSHGLGQHSMNSVDHYELMGHHEYSTDYHHFVDYQDVAHIQESTRSTTNNRDTQITSARTIGTQATQSWTPYVWTTGTQAIQTSTRGTQANHTRTTGTQATLKITTGTQTIRARRKVRETFSFSSKIISSFLLLLLLAVGIAHYTHMNIHVREIQREVQSLRQQADMLVPLAHTIPNFALESQGARVLHDLSSDTYFPQDDIKTIWDRICYWLYIFKTRRRAIQGHSSLQPGQCWAFSGDRGHLLISLSHPVSITNVTIGHITKSQSPHGNITSAPRGFSVYGMRNTDDEGIKFGTLIYDQDGPAYQTFKLANPDKGVFKYVKLQIESNWGNLDYTCLYSFRVHGKLPA